MLRAFRLAFPWSKRYWTWTGVNGWQIPQTLANCRPDEGVSQPAGTMFAEHLTL
jgi:hypothetical protein